MAAVLAAGIGVLILVGVAGSDSSIKVTQGDFELTCPTRTVVEGDSLACTLKNTATEAKPWPVVAILHLSTDTDRALVRGSSIDVTLGTPSPEAAIDGGVTWIGDTLVGYSRFDWSGFADADPGETATSVGAPGSSRTVNIVAPQDSLDENSERFYVALGPDGSRGVGFLYNNKARVTLTDDDGPSTDISLSSLELFAGQSYALSPTQSAQWQTVAYEVTEATLTAAAARGTTMTMSASVDGSSLDLDGMGGASIEVISDQQSAAVPLAVGTTTVALTVTAEDGTTTGTHTVSIVRLALGDDVDEVAVSVPSFTLTCPATVTAGTQAQCTLWASGPAKWPVVAVLHSSADGTSRALVAEDPIIPDTHPDYSKDVSLGWQQPTRTAFNHGYGELFSGGSRTLYHTYGYEKFEWSGTASAGAERTVTIDIYDNTADDGPTPKVFYVALAPSGYTGLSQLVDNKVPILLKGQNRAPSFDGRAPGWVTAPPGTLVSLEVWKSDFIDPDGDTLKFSLSASRDDIYVPGDLVYVDRLGRIFFAAKTACALSGLGSPPGGTYDTVVAMTATDPTGAAAQATATFRTSLAGRACPSLSTVEVDGAALTMAFDGALATSYKSDAPTADHFSVAVEGTAVKLAGADAVSVSGDAAIGGISGPDTISLRLAEPVAAGQTVTVTYTPGDYPLAAAFTDRTVTNLTSPPPRGSILTVLCTPAQAYDAANQRWTLQEPPLDSTVPGSLVAGKCSTSLSEGNVGAVYSLSGADADLFEISVEGVLSFAAAPDFAAPADSDNDNVYEVAVTATVGDRTMTIDLVVAVTDAQETTVNTILTVLCTPAQAYDATNQRWTLQEPPLDSTGEPYVTGALIAGWCSVSDGEGTVVASYSLSGADADLFEISAEGELSFAAAPNFAAPADSDNDNVYEVTVTATVGSQTIQADLAVAVTDAQETTVIIIEVPATAPPVCAPDPTGSMVAVCAAVSDNEITLTFNRSLAAVDDTAAATLYQSFLIDGGKDSHGRPVDNQSPLRVTVDGATVTLTLGAAIAPGDDATVTYFGGGGLTDADGDAVAKFTVTLTTTQRD